MKDKNNIELKVQSLEQEIVRLKHTINILNAQVQMVLKESVRNKEKLRRANNDINKLTRQQKS